LRSILHLTPFELCFGRKLSVSHFRLLDVNAFF
jgi:hypothetical protein